MTSNIIREEINQEMQPSQPLREKLTCGGFSDAQYFDVNFGVTLLTGIVLSVMAAAMVWQSERDQWQHQYEIGTKKVAIALQKAINHDLKVFEEVKAFYLASQEVKETEFQLFVQGSMSQHSGVELMGWIPCLPATPNPGLGHLPETHSVPTQTSDREPSLPVKYLASRFHSELDVGFDFAQAKIFEKFQQAKDTGEITIFNPNPIFNPMNAIASSDSSMPEQPLKIWAISAIYQKSFNYSTVELRRQNLQGFLIASFNLTNILKEIKLSPESDEWEILQTSNLVIFPGDPPLNSPFDGALVKSNQRSLQSLPMAIYEPQTGSWAKALSANSDLNLAKSLCAKTNGCIFPLPIGNEQWSLQFFPTAAYIKAQLLSKSWLTLFFGLSITGIVSAYLPRLLSHYGKLKKCRILSQRMQQELIELQLENQKLKNLLKATNEYADQIKKELEKALKEQNDAYQEMEQFNLELRRINSEVMLLGKMSNVLQACFTEEEAKKTISEFMSQLFPQHSGGIYRICESVNIVELLVSWGETPPSDSAFPIQDCWSLRSGRSHLFDREYNDLPCQHYHSNCPEQSFCIPLMAQGEIFGMLHLTASSSSAKLTAAKQKLALAVAEHTGLALANLKLRETLQFQSIRDGLTGLYNRRYLAEYLATETHRCQRSGKSFAVVMIDVDHFKQFNDTFGHETGDMVLQELGHFLQKSVRSSDVVCRYGGEELTLILSEVSLEDTQKIAEKIRLGVKQLNLKYHHQSVGGITISLGIAIFPQDGWTSERLLASADQALYRAKREGRDRVVAASELEKSSPLLKVLS